MRQKPPGNSVTSCCVRKISTCVSRALQGCSLEETQATLTQGHTFSDFPGPSSRRLACLFICSSNTRPEWRDVGLE
ncbi:hypothetical protein TgHK011_004991 [Trichoderma gracile]|nr:hypothetical protein TgHK011_004991 [Trichoderma gracile]